MKTCEFVLFDERPKRKGWSRFYSLCSKPATHLWTSRSGRLKEPMPVCTIHGEQLAGKFVTSELKPI